MRQLLRALTRRPADLAVLLVLAVASTMAHAAAGGAVTARAAIGESAPPFLADVRVHTPEAVDEVLARLDEVASDTAGFPAHEPVVMVLHGDEAQTFTRANYGIYKDLVDRAARLEAFGLLDVRICERWMRSRGVMQSDLPSFVETVPDGMAEERRLEEAGYLRF
jgi:intracellular sulfur oxidation DsrE/DsrF family protein